MTKTNVKVIKRTKKVNEKDLAKNSVMEVIEKALKENGYNFECGVKFGMTNGTLVVHDTKADVQIKPISPKSGIDRYPVIVYEEE